MKIRFFENSGGVLSMAVTEQQEEEICIRYFDELENEMDGCIEFFIKWALDGFPYADNESDEPQEQFMLDMTNEYTHQIAIYEDGKLEIFTNKVMGNGSYFVRNFLDLQSKEIETIVIE